MDKARNRYRFLTDGPPRRIPDCGKDDRIGMGIGQRQENDITVQGLSKRWGLHPFALYRALSSDLEIPQMGNRASIGPGNPKNGHSRRKGYGEDPDRHQRLPARAERPLRRRPPSRPIPSPTRSAAGSEWLPVCPEVECCLGVPREAMRLVGDPESPAP
jgi:hypothetical protein